MAFTPKTWQNSPSTATPISAAALIDLETRLAAYTDSPGVTTISDANYTALSTDAVIVYSSLTVSRKVTLPTSLPQSGQQLMIVDGSGQADYFPIIIVPGTGGSINGGIAAVLKEPWGSITLTWAGSAWVTSGWCATARPATSQITGTTHYVDAIAGLDANSGTSPGSPWQTVTKVNTLVPSAGDGVLFQGGQSFTDSDLEPFWTGSAAHPIIIGSYGTGQATLGAGVFFTAGTYIIFDNLKITVTSTSNANIVGLGNSSNRVSHITVQRCEISKVGDTTHTNDGIYCNGTDHTFIGNYIHDIPAQGIQLGEPDGLTNGIYFNRNIIANVGLNLGLGFNAHSIYGDSLNVAAIDNLLIGTSSSGISQRYRNWMLRRNHMAGGQVGIEFLETDTVGGKSVWDDNTITAMTAGAIYVGSADDGNNQALESFVISGNKLASTTTGTIMNLHPTWGTYETYGNVGLYGQPIVQDSNDPFQFMWPNQAFSNGGQFTSTTGAVTTVAIAHQLKVAPTKIEVIAANTATRGAPAMFVSVDAANITLNFASALTTATSYSWFWRAER